MLRDELDYADLTVKELSAMTGIPKGTLDSYLGVRASIPPADIACKIAGALGVSVEYLATGRDRQVPRWHNRRLRSLVDAFFELDPRGQDTLCALASVLKKQSKSQR
jgi:transcriptional regulator with XRE-family HTH domain